MIFSGFLGAAVFLSIVSGLVELLFPVNCCVSGGGAGGAHDAVFSSGGFS